MSSPRKDQETNTATEASQNAVQRAVDEAASTTRVAADEASAAARHTAGAAAEIARSGAETMQQTVQSSLDMAAQMTERTISQIAQAVGLTDKETEQTAQQTTRNVQAIIDCGTVIAQGLQDISREWMGQTQDQLQKNLDSMSKLLRARSPQDAIAVQSDLARDNLEDMLQRSRRVSERMLAIADEAMGKITGQARQTATQAHRAR